jgi:hypothetical protein
MEAGKRLITDIFNRARVLEIPFFQRAYVWAEENWDRFFDDMTSTASSGRPYFLGSIILKQRPTTSKESFGDVRSVVDGQQRLTTLCIFFKAICERNSQPELFNGIFRTLTNQITLRHNHSDIEIFEAVLDDKVTLELRAKYRGSQVLKAYDYFQRRLTEGVELNPLGLIQSCYFVGIDLGANEDEQQIFDTINSLGVALSTAELLKNELYRRDDIALYEETWKAVFERDEESKEYWGVRVTAGRSKRETIDLFLQCFLAIQPGVKSEISVENLFSEYLNYLRGNAGERAAFARQLSRTASIFRSSFRVAVLEEELGSSNSLDRLAVFLFGLNITTVMPYVLYILTEVEDTSERQRIFQFLEGYLVRRLVCQETTKNYNNVFSSFIRNGLSSHGALTDRLLRTTDPGIRLPADEAFVAGFASSHLSNVQAKVVLYLLESAIRDTSKHSTSLAGLNHYSLEHLLPKKWRNHWDEVPDTDAQAREAALRKVGNLSLLSASLNISIRDANWAVKKAGSRDKHGLVRYAAGLETLAPDLALDEWNEGTIRDRGARLAKQALLVWPGV